MKNFAILIILLSTATGLLAQRATTFEARLKGFDQRSVLQENSLISDIAPQSIGPSVFSCRVTDVDANPANPSEMYVAYASAGLWYSSNNGTTFKPVFDHEASMTIGDIAVDWRKNIIWVGTGEANSSRSSYAGTGIYRSTDGGASWEWRGLPESHHISRIVLHPTNPDIIWVAVLGHLYTPNPERGVYRSSDGGLTWQRTLFVDENSGAIDLCVDPAAPNTVYAATWQKDRKAWNFDGAGAGSGIWKSTDAGATFTKISTPSSGFPTGDKVGRIGLAAGLKDNQTVLYACVDNQFPAKKNEKRGEEKDELTKEALRKMTPADFAKIENAQLAGFLKKNDFPEEYTAASIKSKVAKGKISPLTLVEYLEDANNNLFETDYTGAEVYRSTDGGATWKKTVNDPLEQMYFTYGYYFSNVRCAPENADQVYLLGYNIIRSDDGGASWKKISADNVHPDHHALWINPAKPNYILNGNDGGLNISWDAGESWILCNNPPVGQFYAIAVDESEPYNVFGGAQDNGVWVGPSNYEASTGWQADGQYPYKNLLGGDGMQIAVDTRDNATVFTGFQFGNYFRIGRRMGRMKKITPKHELGERPLRFNWQTPIQLSSHQQDILYFGANRLYRSFNQGDSWEPISGDLTNGGKAGNVPFGTLTTIHESPKTFGLIYTGSDDGLIHLTRDGGDTWTRITEGLPKGLWVSRVQASSHEKSRVYVTLNGYRNDDFTAWVYVSEDYGKTWTRLGLDLPIEPVNVIREDPVNPELLYVGTDHGVYLSLDRGQTFSGIGGDFPAVPVHDLAIQAKAKELVIGTHGRSMFKVSVAELQELTPEVKDQPLHLFPIADKRFAQGWGKKTGWNLAKDPESVVSIYTSAAGTAQWSVRLQDGPDVQQGEIKLKKGLNTFSWNLDINPTLMKGYLKKWNDKKSDDKIKEIPVSDTGKQYLQRGVYIFSVEKAGEKVEKTFTIE